MKTGSFRGLDVVVSMAVPKDTIFLVSNTLRDGVVALESFRRAAETRKTQTWLTLAAMRKALAAGAFDHITFKTETTMGSDEQITFKGWALRWADGSKNGVLYFSTVVGDYWQSTLGPKTTFADQGALLRKAEMNGQTMRDSSPGCFASSAAHYQLGKVYEVSVTQPDDYVIMLDDTYLAGGFRATNVGAALRFSTSARAWTHAKDTLLSPPVLGEQTVRVFATKTMLPPQTRLTFEPVA